MEYKDEIVLTREELYERVWSTPMSHLAKEFGLSDVGLAKLCSRIHIPRPRLGHWSKKAAGKKTYQRRLPNRSDLESCTVHFRPRPEASEPEEEEPFDDDVQRCLAKAEALPKVEVPTALRRPHPLIQAKNEEHRVLSLPWDSQERHYEKLPATLCLSVSSDNRGRALRYFNSLIRTVEKLGGSIEVTEDYRQRSKTVVTLGGEEVATIRVRELYRQQPNPEGSYPKYDLVPTGKLVLDHGASGFESFHSKDRATSKVEDDINRTIIWWIKQLGWKRIEDRRKAEKEKRRQEIKVERERIREEFERRQQEEQSRLDLLMTDAANLRQSQIIRDYVGTVVRSGRYEPGSSGFDTVEDWTTWALEQADRIDPLSPSPHSVLDEVLREEDLPPAPRVCSEVVAEEELAPCERP